MDSEDEDCRTGKFASERNDWQQSTPQKEQTNRLKPGKLQRAQKRQERLSLDLQALGTLSDLDRSDPRFHVLAAKALKESQIHLVKNVVQTLGPDATFGLLQRTRDIQNSGGMKSQGDGSLKTSGGVFFTLVKEIASPEAKQIIFQSDKNAKRLARLEKRRLEGDLKGEFEVKPASVNLVPR